MVSDFVTIGNLLRVSEGSETYFFPSKTLKGFPSRSRKRIWVSERSETLSGRFPRIRKFFRVAVMAALMAALVTHAHTLEQVVLVRSVYTDLFRH